VVLIFISTLTVILIKNKRLTSVFKNGKNGKAYFIQGLIFTEEDGCTYTNINSHVYVDFPCIPKSKVLNAEETKEFLSKIEDK